jgi:hypothetical protein
MTLCGHCFKEIDPLSKPHNNSRSPKKYCSSECKNLAYDMRKYHRKWKHDPERSARVAQHAREWREKQKRLGNCSRCGRPNDTTDSTCSDCRGLSK